MIRKIAFVCIVVFAIAAAGACGGSSGVDISGKQPAEAAQLIAEAICDWNVECGDWNIQCDIDPAGGNQTCTATAIPVTGPECVSEIKPEVQSDLESCTALTDAQTDIINDCVNMITSLACVTEAEVNAFVDALNRGEDPEYPLAFPPVCDEMQAIFAACAPADA